MGFLVIETKAGLKKPAIARLCVQRVLANSDLQVHILVLPFAYCSFVFMEP